MVAVNKEKALHDKQLDMQATRAEGEYLPVANFSASYNIVSIADHISFNSL